MGHLGEALAWLAAYTLRRRVRRYQRGMLRLQPLEPVHERVILGVGDFRCVEHVVEMFVVANLFAKSLNLFAWLLCRLLGRHSDDYRERLG
jgi:hypothetical protein